MKIVSNIRVGKPDTTPDSPAHTPGVAEGNAPGNYQKQAGFNQDGTVTAERSTGINHEARNPIHPDSPNLPPP